MKSKNSVRPDYYLVSHDLDRDAVVRAVYSVKQLKFESRNDLLLVNIDPPYDGKNLGLNAKRLRSLVIASRWVERPLLQPTGYPISVYIFAPLTKEIVTLDEIKKSHIDMIAWGEIYPTPEWAEDPYGYAKISTEDNSKI